jgi:hypothetical protein
METNGMPGIPWKQLPGWKKIGISFHCAESGRLITPVLPQN